MRRILFSLLLALATASAALANPPKAVPLEPIKDLDIVAKGDTVSHTFQIRNDGGETLQIEDVRPACGCTVAKFDAEIAPGKVGTVRASLDTTDFYGPITKSISVYTNDTENPQLQLVLKAKVVPYISALPGQARYLYVQNEYVEPIPQNIWSADEHPLTVLDVRTDSKKIEVSFRPAKPEEEREEGKGHKQWVVDILLKKNAEIGTLREWVEVVTDHPKQRLARIPVSGFVRPRQHVTPNETDFGDLQGDALPLRRSFHFTNFITDDIQVTKVETGYPAMTVDVEPQQKDPGHRFKLTLNIGPDMPKGHFETVIKLHISDPKHPIVELPVRGNVL